MENCEHIDTSVDEHGVIRCVQQGGCGKVVGREATKAMANAAFNFIRQQKITTLESLTNSEMRGLIDAAMAIQPIT